MTNIKTISIIAGVAVVIIAGVILGVSVFSTADAVDDTTQIISSSEVVEEVSSSSELTKEEIKEIYEIKAPEKEDETESPTEYEEDINSPYIEYEQEEVVEEEVAETSNSSEPPKQQTQSSTPQNGDIKVVNGVKYGYIPGLGWIEKGDGSVTSIPAPGVGEGPQVLH